jgi:hypothetical protein
VVARLDIELFREILPGGAFQAVGRFELELDAEVAFISAVHLLGEHHGHFEGARPRSETVDTRD